MPIDDTVSLVIGSVAWSGFSAIRVTRGIERMPSDFSVSLTELYPGAADKIDIQPGTSVVLKIGSDTVITGWIDRYMPSIDAGSHTIDITGRGLCQDIVDCSAIFLGQQIMQSDALGIARQVCKPFNIPVTTLVTDLRPVYQFNSVLTETAYAIIERVTRYSGVVAYEGTDGSLILARVPDTNKPLGSQEMASGFAQGVNVQSARGMRSMDQRFSLVQVIITANPDWQNNPAEQPAGPSTANTLFTAEDKTVPRYRPHLIVSEQCDSVLATAQQRANWEIARRYGRSQAVSLTCDSWRDSAGTLWAINTLATVDIPDLKISNKKWLITEVTFTKDVQRGTVADITLMPPEGFNPEPLILYPFDQQVAADLSESGNPVRQGNGLGAS